MAESSSPVPYSTPSRSGPGRLRAFLWPDWRRRKKMLRAEAWAVVIASYVLLTFAYLWPQDYRNASTPFVVAAWAAFLVRALQFHLGLLLLVIALAGAFGRGRRLFLAAVPPLLFTLVPALLQFLPRTPPPPAGGSPALRVMSVNLLMVNQETDAMIAEIRAADPDVLLIQEYTDHWHRALRGSLGGAYPHHSYVDQDDSFGAAVYSKTPFVEEVEQFVPLSHNACPQFRAVIEYAGRRVALYNIHLLPPRTPEYTTGHRLQFADLLDVLRDEPLPYVLAGDFNFPETAPQHAALRRAGVREAHELAGKGRGATWPVNGPFRYLPGLRFDHVYLSPAFTATRCETGAGKGSDHRPVVADVALDANGS
jgi:endonuclease/exonuclease/phosphatase (EEP) superfamily protein YafD